MFRLVISISIQTHFRFVFFYSFFLFPFFRLFFLATIILVENWKIPASAFGGAHFQLINCCHIRNGKCDRRELYHIFQLSLHQNLYFLSNRIF